MAIFIAASSPSQSQHNSPSSLPIFFHRKQIRDSPSLPVLLPSLPILLPSLPILLPSLPILLLNGSLILLPHPNHSIRFLPLPLPGRFAIRLIVFTRHFLFPSFSTLHFFLCFSFLSFSLRSFALLFLLFIVFQNKQTHTSPSISRNTLS